MNRVHCPHTSAEPETDGQPLCPRCRRESDPQWGGVRRKAGPDPRRAGVVQSPALRIILLLALAVGVGLVGYYFMGEPDAVESGESPSASPAALPRA